MCQGLEREAEDTKGKLNDRSAKCPFFRAHTGTGIYCESPIPDSGLRLSFDREGDKKTQYRAFCCKKYENCELYRAIMRNYEEDIE